ncbi:putative DNA binding domain-containing protein [bacterium]|nr:putative DNA binding domain-containing protein [bacterium]
MEKDKFKSNLKELLTKGEGIRLEYKEARSMVPGDLFETVCAMLNRDGGDILLGVNDKGRVTGITVEHLDKIKSNIVALSNNPQKLDPPFILFPIEVIFRGKRILQITIPASSQVHKCNKTVYDRSDDGDFRVVEPHRIAEISNRKLATYSENKIFKGVAEKDLEVGLLNRIRNMILSRNPNHPWPTLNNKELMRKAGLFRTDFETGEEGYTLAAVLLLGKSETIHSVLPHYKIDALVRINQFDRYDDRDNIDSNIIKAYDRLMAFISKHLPDPFYMEGNVRISLRDKIFREIIANFLVHREYLSAYPARMTIFKERIETENASNYKIKGAIDPERIVPFSKNPTIAKFFSQIGWAEELGSGMVNIGKYLPHYKPGGVAKFQDGPVFTASIPIPPFPETIIDEFREKFSVNFSVKFSVRGKQLKRLTEIIQRLADGKILDIKELADEFSVSERTIYKDFARLKEWNLVVFMGSPKTGAYILTATGKGLWEDAYE